ncbi:MAG: Mov34/MPN/PAD-1 family protein, partial [Bacteroidota bacterium]
MKSERFSITSTKQSRWEERNGITTIPEHKFWVEVSPKAWSVIEEHIGWGTETENNQVEQGGILLGHACKDSYKALYWVEVSHAIPAHQAEGSMKHLHFSHTAWYAMFQEAEVIHPDAQVIGWYHTHPKHLRVYFSETDRATQKQFFYQPWHVGLVFNPQQRVARAFRGK